MYDDEMKIIDLLYVTSLNFTHSELRLQLPFLPTLKFSQTHQNVKGKR